MDGVDEQEAMLASRRAGWAIQGLVSSSERVGLAQHLPIREGHALLFSGRDANAVREAVSKAVHEHCAAIRFVGARREILSRMAGDDQTVSDYLAFVDVPDDGRVDLPDDERLIEAIESLWGLLDEAGARAVGEAFLVSERGVREHYARLAETLGDPPGEESWDEMMAESLEHYRSRQRLVP